MKAAPFSYVRPTSLADVVAELTAAETAGGGKILAGGQSLMPVLAMRLGRPGTLIDITRVPELSHIDEEADTLRIGAAVTQRRGELEIGNKIPLVSKALPWIGHREIRSRGTICGSLAHADPAAELPAVALCLGATITVIGTSGARDIPASEFFTSAMSTAVNSGEVVTSVSFPLQQPGEGFAFAEIARRHGDFALAGVAARVLLDEGKVREARLVSFGVADRPQQRDFTAELAQAVVQHDEDERALTTAMTDVIGQAASEIVTTPSDTNASQEYRRRLVRTLGTRALIRACADSRRRARQ